MATSLKADAIGYLVQDPSYTKGEGDKMSIARFRIIHTPYSSPGQPDAQAINIDVVAFGRLADIVGSYAKKGKQVYVSGRVSSLELAKDKSGKMITYKTGDPVIRYEIQASDFTLLGKKDDESEGTSSQTSTPMEMTANVPF